MRYLCHTCGGKRAPTLEEQFAEPRVRTLSPPQAEWFNEGRALYEAEIWAHVQAFRSAV